MRQERSQPLITELQTWLREQRARLSKKSDTTKAINYSLNRWTPSPASSMMGAFACRTTRRNANCGPLLSGERTEPSLMASAFLAALCLPALACGPGNPNCGNQGGQGNQGNQGNQGGGGTHGVPGPLVGAGLPVLAVGYGAYWLVRRYRRKSDAV